MEAGTLISLPSFKLFVCFLLVNIYSVECDVIVLNKNNQTIDIFNSLTAGFGAPLPINGLKGSVIIANPSRNACEPIDPPPYDRKINEKWIVLIQRYDCKFVEKVRNAQESGYDAAIIYNIGSNMLEPMAGDDDDIVIPALFIGQDDGVMIATHYQYFQGFKLLLTTEQPFNLNNYLLPFAIVVAICFLLMLVFFLVKCIKDRRRMRRYRLPSSCLKSIPCIKFKKGDPYDTCAICLEDYVDGEKLRLLPCSHAYHCKCIDPWLTRNRRVCPVCKRRVLARGEHFSDSEDSETESETSPLLRPGSYGTQGGTFINTSANLLPVPEPTLENNDESREEEVDVHEEPSSLDPSVSTLVDLSGTLPEFQEDDSFSTTIPGNVVSSHEVVIGTPPSQNTEEDNSIYFTPQNVVAQQDFNV